MLITLGANIAALRSQRQLASADAALGTVFERLASGQRINRASDDAAGLAISESLKTDQRVYTQGVRNLNDGVSLLNIADGALSELSNIVIRLQELAEQSANGTFSNQQREALDTEAQELKAEFFRISRSAEFNGQQLFDGSLENGVRLQAGYGIDGSIFSSLGGELGDGTFTQGVSVGTGNGTVDVAIGDLNGDGNLDIVSANRISDDVTVSLGNGDGSFQGSVTFAAATNAYSVELGDVNGDGILDIVSMGIGNSTAVLLGQGDGSFSSAQTFSIGGTLTFEMSIGDLNGDGNLDIITANYFSQTLSFAFGNGDGTFSGTQSLALTSGPGSLVVGDINGDGALDIAAAAYSGSTNLAIFLGNGDGTFQTRIDQFLGSQSLALSLGDLNGDGIADIVNTNYSLNGVNVLLGNGDGTFSSQTSFGAGSGTSDVELGDVNGDGILDIITANGGFGYTSSVGSDDISVLLGRGDGTFEASQTFQSPAGAFNLEISLGDFNNDGVLDIANGSRDGDNVGILLGDTREGVAPILDFSLKTQADALQALAPLERKLNSLSEQRGTIGAFQSRLESALATLGATTQNYAAAASRIRDIDIAFETSQLTRLNILQRAASAILGQANQQPALAIQLLQ